MSSARFAAGMPFLIVSFPLLYAGYWLARVFEAISGRRVL